VKFYKGRPKLFCSNFGFSEIEERKLWLGHKKKKNQNWNTKNTTYKDRGKISRNYLRVK